MVPTRIVSIAKLMLVLMIVDCEGFSSRGVVSEPALKKTADAGTDEAANRRMLGLI